MKLLIIGTGVIGSTYGWQLSKAGYNVTLLVKKEVEDLYKNQGITIEFVDKRQKKRIEGKEVLHLNVDSLEGIDDDYDFVFVPVQRQHIIETLKEISGKLQKSTIVIFQNNWKCSEEFEEILQKEQYIYAFPHMVGGTRENRMIKTIIFGDGNTRIGAVDNSNSDKVNSLYEILKEAGMRPKITENIEHWIISHYIQQSSGIGVFLKYGSPTSVVRSYRRISELIDVAREGLKVCEKRGINARKISPINFLYYPKLLTVPMFKRMFSDDDELFMIEGHMKNGLKEMVTGYEEVLQEGKELGLKMNKWESYSSYVSNAKKANL
ncbi:MAG: ketopantoate reductase family protein [Bacillota bacterium]